MRAAAFLFNHSVRSYRSRGIHAGIDYDGELLFLACILHDMGLTREGNGNQRFEVDGADLAAAFLDRRGMSRERIEIVWDAIALHTTSTIPGRKRPEIALTQAGIMNDVFALSRDKLPVGYAEKVHQALPRLKLGTALADAIVDQVKGNQKKLVGASAISDLVRQKAPHIHQPTWDENIAAGWRE
ncbi:HD domain-containing protein [Streptomyces sp. NPDC020192]|uniref:HD domain-containing protein n=1 Tax=Streptomyces sp. NPDC020192 TaxID=3365066 RepID=UPI0037966291